MNPRSLPRFSLLSRRWPRTSWRAALPSSTSSMNRVARGRNRSARNALNCRPSSDSAASPPARAGECPMSTSRNSTPQRPVQVRAGAGLRARQLDLHQVAQPVQAVAGVVGLRTGRQDTQLGGGLGVEQEQDPVEEPQRLLGQLVRLGRRKGLEAAVPASAHHLVGDDLDGQPHPFAQVLRDPDGVPDRLLQHTVPPQRAVGVGSNRLRGQAGQRAVDLAAAPVVVALAHQLQVDGQVAALGPPALLGEDRQAPSQQQHQLGGVVGDE